MISMQFQGKDAFLSHIAKMCSREQREDLSDNLGSYLLSSTQQRFVDERGPDGEKWKPSARAEASGGKTLRLTGQLFSSYTYESSAERVEVGSNKVYAGIHHGGGIIKPKSGKKLVFRMGAGFVFADKVTMPARPALGINQQDREEMSLIAKDWMEANLQ